MKRGWVRQSFRSFWACRLSSFSRRSLTIRYRSSFTANPILRRLTVNRSIAGFIGILCANLAHRRLCMEDNSTTEVHEIKPLNLNSVTFPHYKTILDVKHWLRSYHSHPDIELLIEAVKIILTEGSQTDIWYTTGLLSSVFASIVGNEQMMGETDAEDLQNFSDLVSKFLDTIPEQRRSVIFTALWLSNTTMSQSYFKSLLPDTSDQISTDETDETSLTDTKPMDWKQSLAVQFLSTPPMRLLDEYTDFDFDTVKMHLELLKGIYSACKDERVVKRMISGAEGWTPETLEKDGNAERFIVSKLVREELILMCADHEDVLNICKAEAKDPATTGSRKRVLLGILEVVDALLKKEQSSW